MPTSERFKARKASIRRLRNLSILTGSLMVLTVLGVTGPSGAAPVCPRPGYVANPVPTEEDRNGNGVVCVNEDGSIVDDTGQTDPNGPDRRDANDNGFLCWNMDKNVVTDDQERTDPDTGLTSAECPPSFQLFPEQAVPGGNG